MNRPSLSIPFALLFALPAAAQGQVLLEQLPNQFSFTFADTDCNVCGPGSDQSLAENFVIQTSSAVDLNQIVIWGVHDGGTTSDPNQFSVIIFEDDAGLPGPVVYQELDMASTAVPTGMTVSGEAELEVTLTPGMPTQLASGTYWIEIFNSTTSTSGSWGWISSPFDPTTGVDGYSFSTTAPGGTWFEDNFQPGPGHNLALRLVGEGGGLGDDYCISVANSTGGASLISALGTVSIVANNLTLSASSIPNGQTGLFFYGPEQVLLPFGNGFRCVGAGGSLLSRLPVTNASATGFLTWAVDNTAPPTPAGQLTAGSTWNFQAWYRDPQGGGSFFNLSNGLELTFLP